MKKSFSFYLINCMKKPCYNLHKKKAAFYFKSPFSLNHIEGMASLLGQLKQEGGFLLFDIRENIANLYKAVRIAVKYRAPFAVLSNLSDDELIDLLLSFDVPLFLSLKVVKLSNVAKNLVDY